MRRSSVLTGSLLLALLPACAAKSVQLYEGPKLPDDQVTTLWTNPRLQIEVDRQYKHPADQKALHRIDLPPGSHAVEVRCLYDNGQVSPVLALLMEGEAGHRYKPRVQFSRDEGGSPRCKAKVFDVTSEPDGHKIDLY
jgi:hypothetical protein